MGSKMRTFSVHCIRERIYKLVVDDNKDIIMLATLGLSYKLVGTER